MLMSKDALVFGIVCIAAFAIALVPGAFDALFALVFIGMVPFSDYTLPPAVMLALYTLLIVLGLRWIIVQPLLMTDAKKREVIERTKARKRVMKKTAHTHSATHTAKRKRYQQTAKQTG